MVPDGERNNENNPPDKQKLGKFCANLMLIFNFFCILILNAFSGP